MADIRRGTQDPNFTNFINPGVVDNSASVAAAGLADAAIQLDTGLAKEKLKKQIEDIRTERIVGAPSVVSAQDSILGPDTTQGGSDAAPSSPHDDAAVANVSGKLAQLDAARQQGIMTDEWMKIRAERLVRQAIARRPGLASQFRDIAAQALGTDVVGSTVEVLAQADKAQAAAAAQQADALSNRVKEMRKQLFEVAGLPTEDWTDDQVIAEYHQRAPQIEQVMRTKAARGVADDLAATQKAGQELRRPQSTQDFVTKAYEIKSAIYKNIEPTMAYLRDPANSPQDKAQVLTATRAQLQVRVSELQAAAASGDVDQTVVGREIDSVTNLVSVLDKYVTGETANDLTEQDIRGIGATAQFSLLDASPDAKYFVAASKLFGPETMAQFFGPTGEFREAIPIAMAKAMSGVDTPSVTTSTAGEGVSALVQAVLDPSRAKRADHPEKVNSMVDYTVKTAQAFVAVPDSEFRIGQFSGPTGFVGKLNLHAKAITAALTVDQRVAVASNLADATYNAIRVMKAALFQKYPSLKGKVVDELDPDSGELFHPLVEDAAGKPVQLSAPEKAALQMFNTQFRGKQVLDTISVIGGYAESKGSSAGQMVVDLVYKRGAMAEAEHEAARRAQEAAAQEARHRATPTGGDGTQSGSQKLWWQAAPPGVN